MSWTARAARALLACAVFGPLAGCLRGGNPGSPEEPWVGVWELERKSYADRDEYLDAQVILECDSAGKLRGAMMFNRRPNNAGLRILEKYMEAETMYSFMLSDFEFDGDAATGRVKTERVLGIRGGEDKGTITLRRAADGQTATATFPYDILGMQALDGDVLTKSTKRNHQPSTGATAATGRSTESPKSSGIEGDLNGDGVLDPLENERLHFADSLPPP